MPKTPNLFWSLVCKNYDKSVLALSERSTLLQATGCQVTSEHYSSALIIDQTAVQHLDVSF